MNILDTIPTLKKAYPNAEDDYELMNNWANNIDLSNITPILSAQSDILLLQLFNT